MCDSRLRASSQTLSSRRSQSVDLSQNCHHEFGALHWIHGSSLVTPGIFSREPVASNCMSSQSGKWCPPTGFESSSSRVFHVLYETLFAIGFVESPDVPTKSEDEEAGDESDSGGNSCGISETSFSGSNIGAMPHAAYFRRDLAVRRRALARQSQSQQQTWRTAIGKLGYETNQRCEPVGPLSVLLSTHSTVSSDRTTLSVTASAVIAGCAGRILVGNANLRPLLSHCSDQCRFTQLFQ